MLESDLQHVVLTGGEPMLSAESVSLCQMLRQAGRHVTIETAGTIDREIECDLMSISPKLRSSGPDDNTNPSWAKVHESRRLPLDIMRNLIDRSPSAQVKFVVDSPVDYTEVLDVVQSLGVPGDDVWIMPQGSTIEAMDDAIEWLKPWTRTQGFQYCDRMQIRWFGNRKGT